MTEDVNSIALTTAITAEFFREQLYKPDNHKTLYAAARILTRRPDKAEDLVQTTYQKALEAYERGSYIEQGLILGWLIRVLQSEFRDSQKSNQNKLARKTRSVEDEDIDPYFRDNRSAMDGEEVSFRGLLDIAATQIHQNAAVAWAQIISLVPAEDRPMFLAIVTGDPYAEVAEALGIGVQALKSRMNRLRAKLRIHLAMD